jgi:uncharacterized protein (TIGR03437 family)
MKRLAFALLLPLLAGSLWSQKISSTRIYTEPSGAGFYVDEMYYTAPVTFLWAERTSHTLRVAPVTEINPGSRITCSSGWADSTGDYVGTSPVTTFLADPKVTYYKTSCTQEYKFTLSFFSCSSADINDCGGGVGQIYVNGVPYDRTTEFWVPAGTALKLQVMPAKGWAFIRWELGLTTDNSFMTTVTLNGPLTLPARFEPAKEINLRTEPAGLKVLVDRQPLQTPVTLYWAYGSQHTLGSVSPQINTTASDWVFDSWDNGAPDNFVHTVSTVNAPDNFTAKYVHGAQASFLTAPRGLKLSIDGRDNWPAYNFLWPVGSKHTIVAPPEQTDSKGRRYAFKNWSNGAPATQELVMDASMIPVGPTLIATYEVLGRVTLQTNPGGFPILVEGTECSTPCVLDRPAGGQLSIAAPAKVPFTDSTRFDFKAWSDGGPRERILNFTTDSVGLTASYETNFRLVAVADPSEGATVTLDPASADGYYPGGTFVSATAEAKPGFKFRRWDGDASGTFNKVYMTLNGPSAIRANLDRTPYVAPAGVRNAAGETPQTGIAAGSIASIMGASLAGEVLVAESDPLPQTLGNVTVQLADRILPLFYVSPDQINVQIPTGLQPGDYTLTVRWEGHPEVSAPFTIVRNAPGLFPRVIENRSYIVALHEDGSVITVDSPARLSETITILGTGFGPYTRTALDGFRVPKGTELPLIDKVEVLTGDLVLQPVWAGAAVGFVGATGVRLKIGNELPAASAVELRVRVNGVESNKVWLPIQ